MSIPSVWDAQVGEADRIADEIGLARAFAVDEPPIVSCTPRRLTSEGLGKILNALGCMLTAPTRRRDTKPVGRPKKPVLRVNFTEEQLQQMAGLVERNGVTAKLHQLHVGELGFLMRGVRHGAVSLRA
jgi:hypothetical protein